MSTNRRPLVAEITIGREETNVSTSAMQSLLSRILTAGMEDADVGWRVTNGDAVLEWKLELRQQIP